MSFLNKEIFVKNIPVLAVRVLATSVGSLRERLGK